MAQVLTISNQKTEANKSHIVFVESVLGLSVVDDHLSVLDTTNNPYFTENNLVLKIVDEENPLAVFGNILSVNPSVAETIPSENVSSFQFPLTEDVSITMKTFWSLEKDGVRSKSLNYEILDFTFEIISISSEEIICKIPDDQLAYSKDFFKSLSLTKPKFGFSQIKIQSKGFFYKSFWFKTTDEPIVFSSNDVSSTILTPSITENIYLTPPHTFETLFIPTLSASFVYNFYEIDENSFDKASNKNYAGKDLSDIPKFIKLNWNKAPPILEIKPKPLSSAIPEVKKSERPTSFSDEAKAPIKKKSSQVVKLGGFIFTPETEDSLVGSILAGDTDTAKQVQRVFGTGGGFGTGPSPRSGSIQDVIQRGGTSFDTVIRDTSGVAGRARSDAVDSLLDAGGPSAVAREIREDVIVSLGEKTRYVAYVIFKEMYDDLTDEFIPVDVIVVRNINTTSLIDWKVAYGSSYRYKIRTVAKFIVPKEFPIYQDSDATFSEKVSDAFFRDSAILGSGFYYDSEFSDIITVDTLEDRIPDPAYNVKIFPNSKKKNILLTWCQKNQNKDVLGFNVFRKENIKNSFFEQINRDLLSVRDNLYLDTTVLMDKEYIYTIQTVDIHDNKSLLSAQYKVSLKDQNIEHDRVENKVSFFAEEGLILDENPTVKQKEIIEFDKKFEVVINPLFVNLDTDTTFLIKVKSLDTFMIKDVKLNFTTKIINHTKPKPLNVSSKVKNILNQKQKLGLAIKESSGTQIGRKIIK